MPFVHIEIPVSETGKLPKCCPRRPRGRIEFAGIDSCLALTVSYQSPGGKRLGEPFANRFAGATSLMVEFSPLFRGPAEPEDSAVYACGAQSTLPLPFFDGLISTISVQG